MARYNHFSELKYKQISFDSVAIGEKFRMDKFDGKRRRKDVIFTKTGDLSYVEYKSKSVLNFKEHKVIHTSFTVCHFESELNS